MVERKWDPVSGFTHLAGMFLSIAALSILVCMAALHATIWHTVSFAVYGASMILLYAASSFYHLFPVGDKAKKILQNIDHMMIYLLIAGTYTPLCLVPLRGWVGWTLFGIIWACAIAGMIAQGMCRAPRWFSTMLYLIMGWMVAAAFFPLLQAMSARGLMWLVLGGLFYSAGAIVYAAKWPFPSARWFGFHEIFHLFVMAGSYCHFWLMLWYVLKV